MSKQKNKRSVDNDPMTQRINVRQKNKRKFHQYNQRQTLDQLDKTGTACVSGMLKSLSLHKIQAESEQDEDDKA